MGKKKEAILEAAIIILDSIDKIEQKLNNPTSEEVSEIFQQGTNIIDQLCLGHEKYYTEYEDYPWHFIVDNKGLSTEEKVRIIKKMYLR